MLHIVNGRGWLETLAFVLTAKWHMYRGAAIYYVREDRGGNAIVSVATARKINPATPHSAEVSLWWDRDYRGADNHTPVHSWIWLTFLFEEVGLHRLVFRVDERNLRAIRMMEKSQAVFEGVSHLDHREGSEYYSTLQWSMLHSDAPVEAQIAEIKTAHGWPPKAT